MIHSKGIRKRLAYFSLNLMLKNNLPMWRQELKSSRKKEGKSPTSRWVQLATVNDKNEPRLRTVVFRGWRTDNSILLFTDRRSEKVEHLKLNRNAEILWLFLKSKSQFRFKGEINELITNANYWEKLSYKSKLPWFWGYPGKNINYETESNYELPNNSYKPKNFVVLNFEIYSVDLLKLEQPVHRRFIWERKNKWDKVEVNP